MFKVIHVEKSALACYVRRQIEQVFPLQNMPDLSLIDQYVSISLRRLSRCVNEIKVWESDQFDVLHSSQYCTFLYYLSNTIWKETGNQDVCTLLFLLNKALNSIDLFYEIEMPEVFFIGHSVGIVLAKATYGNYLVLYQNSTVGKNHGVAPVIGEGVVMYPNTAIIGRCTVGDRTILSQGTSVINRDTPGDCVAYAGGDGNLVFKPAKRDVLNDIFR